MARPYSTKEDLVKVLPEETLHQLVNDEETGVEADLDARITEAIAQADGEIEMYLGGRYSVPLVTTAGLRRCSCDIAIYHLYARYDETIPETRETRYKDAVRILRDIRDGKMPLEGQTAPGSASDFGGLSFGVVVQPEDS